jgi:hypothetical protein
MQHADLTDYVELAIFKIQVVRVAFDQLRNGNTVLVPNFPKLLDRLNSHEANIGPDLP